MIEYTNSRLCKTMKYLCVTRLCGFGKTYAADMLAAYYGRGCDSHAQFAGRNISESPDYETYINKYNVIYVDVLGYMNQCTKGECLSRILDGLYSGLVTEIEDEYPDIVPGRYGTFPDYLDTVYKKMRVPFVFILDEWNAPIRGTKFGVEEQRNYPDRFTALFKGNAYAALVYMTGVLPIIEYGSHSELNMFTEISMVNADGLRDYTGFTKEEVMRLCEERGKPFEKVRSRCAGYTLDGIVLYVPGSVARAVRSSGEGTDGFGTSDDIFEVLEPYIGVNVRYVRDVLSYLAAGKSVKVNITGFSGNAGPFMFDDNFLTLLIHLGYLTYNRNTKSARVSGRVMKGRLKGLINKIAG